MLLMKEQEILIKRITIIILKISDGKGKHSNLNGKSVALNIAHYTLLSFGAN